jgi:hypothetical protein
MHKFFGTGELLLVRKSCILECETCKQQCKVFGRHFLQIRVEKVCLYLLKGLGDVHFVHLIDRVQFGLLLAQVDDYEEKIFADLLDVV